MRPTERVYPRTRGGTLTTCRMKPGSRGLSPHARGNRSGLEGLSTSQRSIPARAGEPDRIKEAERNHQVYPRTRGGTSADATAIKPATGLSPHVRGNQDAERLASADAGSIPARAGEPQGQSLSSISLRVYPRTRGGTGAGVTVVLPLRGLSPHARGNRRRRPLAEIDGGSIPARAGEPRMGSRLSRQVPVYPRTRGGTDQRRPHPLGQRGLSPHARGNRLDLEDRAGRAGSIPARAGEPYAS